MNAPGLRTTPRSERGTGPESLGDRAWSWGVFRAHQLFHRRMMDPGPFAREVARRAEGMRERALEPQVPELRYRLRRAAASEDLLASCFGLFCAAQRSMCPESGIPSPAAIGAARVLAAGGIVALAGGADRHRALALAAGTIALCGTPVHLLTASDASAEALAAMLRGPCAALGMGVGTIGGNMARHERVDQYANLVTCGALREVGLDFLRDRIRLGGQPRRTLSALDRLSGETSAERELLASGLRCALVDEADQVMLDDSRIPLALTTEADQPGERLAYEQAIELARALHESEHFSVGPERIELTAEGSQRLARLTQALGGMWAGHERREELITIALEALHRAQRDRDYKVIQGRVVFPSQPAEEAGEPDPAEELLQKLVEVKEGCRLSGRRVVLAQITVPRLLGRYRHLAGTCADGRGLEHEFWRLYRLKTVHADHGVPPVHWRKRLLATATAKREALLESIRGAAASGSVVIALRSPAAAQALLEACAQAGIEVGLARGAGDAVEQRALARLDVPGGVIVTLYPAERAVKAAPEGVSPVHLVVAELHDAERHVAHIARAYGARSCEMLLSLEDEAVKAHLGVRAVDAALREIGSAREAPSGRARHWIGMAEKNAERAIATSRADLAAMERGLDDMLAFSGRRE